jgi:hypothetical protein
MRHQSQLHGCENSNIRKNNFLFFYCMYVLSTFSYFPSFLLFPSPFCYMVSFLALTLDCCFILFYFFLALLFVLMVVKFFSFISFFFLYFCIFLSIVVSFFLTYNSSSSITSFPLSVHNLVVWPSALWQAALYISVEAQQRSHVILFYCSRNASFNLVIFVTAKMSNVICLQ